MFVCCECCALSGRGLCDGLITLPEESYRLWCVVVCDLETSKTRRLKPATGLWKIQPQQVVTPGKQTNQLKKHTIKISSTDGRTYVYYSCENWTPTYGYRVDMRGVRYEVMKVVIGAYWEVTTCGLVRRFPTFQRDVLLVDTLAFVFNLNYQHSNNTS
jgi:hypothetical protein